MKEFEELFKRLTDKVHYKPYWDVLIKLYVQGDRHYHNLQHIVSGLDEIKEIKQHLSKEELKEFSEDLVLFTWWGHDSIYYPGHLEKKLVEKNSSEGKVKEYIWVPYIVKDNEEKSSMLMCGFAREMGMPEDFIRDLDELTMLTKHDREPKDINGKIIVDVDLSILGQPSKMFDLYEMAIRREYSWVPEEIFKKERAKILQSFLDRKSIYYTDHFRNKYEDQARKNLEFSIFKLGL